MKSHNHHIGIQGETIATKYLEEAGYSILKLNYRFQRWEIDIIAIKADVLHFIEVKTRTQSKYGSPESAVNDKKMQNILSVADAFQFEFEGAHNWKFIQFDIVAIQLYNQKKPDITMIEDVYLI